MLQESWAACFNTITHFLPGKLNMNASSPDACLSFTCRRLSQFFFTVQDFQYPLFKTCSGTLATAKYFFKPCCNGFLPSKERRTKMQCSSCSTCLMKDDNVNTTQIQNNKRGKTRNSPIWCREHKDRKQPPTNPNTKQAT